MTNVLVCGMLPVHTYMNIGIRPVTYILARLVYVTRADTLVEAPLAHLGLSTTLHI